MAIFGDWGIIQPLTSAYYVPGTVWTYSPFDSVLLLSLAAGELCSLHFSIWVNITQSLVLSIHIFRHTTDIPSVHACQQNEKHPVPDATMNFTRSTFIWGSGCGSVSRSPWHIQRGVSLLSGAFLLSCCNSLSHHRLSDTELM